MFPDGKDSHGYDVRGRGIYSARTLEGFTFETSSAYDDRDRLISTTYPDGRTLSYSYDDAGRTVGIGGVIDTIGYDGRGQAAQTGYANGTSETRGYDDLMRLGSQSLTAPAGPLQDAGALPRSRRQPARGERRLRRVRT